MHWGRHEAVKIIDSHCVLFQSISKDISAHQPDLTSINTLSYEIQDEIKASFVLFRACSDAASGLCVSGRWYTVSRKEGGCTIFVGDHLRFFIPPGTTSEAGLGRSKGETLPPSNTSAVNKRLWILQAYLNELNRMRGGLTKPLPPVDYRESEVRDKAQALSAAYAALERRCDDLFRLVVMFAACLGFALLLLCARNMRC